MTDNELDLKFLPKEKRGLCGSLLLSRWTPLNCDIHIQILKTDLHAFRSKISRENLIEEQSIFPSVTMFYLFSQFYLLMMSCCCLEKINVGPLMRLLWVRNGPLEKLWGAGEVSSHRNFFFPYQILCMNFFRPYHEYFSRLIGVHEFFCI